MALAQRSDEHVLDQVVDVRLAAEQTQADARDVRREPLEQLRVGLRQGRGRQRGRLT
jgi:hypothetical protein